MTGQENVAAGLLMRPAGRSLVIKIAFDAGRTTWPSQALRRLAAAVLLSAKPAAGLAVRPVSELKLQNRNGSPFSLESLKGQVVVLDFWASWCVPCRTSFPFPDALQARYESQGLPAAITTSWTRGPDGPRAAWRRKAPASRRTVRATPVAASGLTWRHAIERQAGSRWDSPGDISEST